MRICPNCGVPNPDGNKCCESCGADMISGNSTGNSSDKSHSEQQEVKNSGLIETMGNTRHVTDPERKETGDVQKHVSGFGLVGSMGNVHYDGDQLEKEEHSKSGEKGDGARETGIDKAYALYHSVNTHTGSHCGCIKTGSNRRCEYTDS